MRAWQPSSPRRERCRTFRITTAPLSAKSATPMSSTALTRARSSNARRAARPLRDKDATIRTTNAFKPRKTSGRSEMNGGEARTSGEATDGRGTGGYDRPERVRAVGEGRAWAVRLAGRKFAHIWCAREIETRCGNWAILWRYGKQPRIRAQRRRTWFGAESRHSRGPPTRWGRHAR